MTQKYLLVRREIYENNPMKKINSTRSFFDMAQLFTVKLWLMLVLVVGSLIGAVVLFVMNPSSPFMIIPLVIIIAIQIIGQVPREKNLYHESARDKELKIIMKNYKTYITDVREALKKYDVDTLERVRCLKEECENQLNLQNDKYTKFGAKAFEMLIGVPLGALIASLIYMERAIAYYSEGFFKDKYLLNVLNELNYIDMEYDKE